MKRKTDSIVFFLFLVGIIPLCTADMKSRIIKLPDLYTPRYMDVDDQRIYIVTNSIGIYCRRLTGEADSFPMKISRGLGPGEYHAPPGITVLDDRIILNSTTKRGFYSRDGHYLKEMKKKFASTVYHLGKNEVRPITVLDSKTKTKTWALDLYSAGGKRPKRLTEYPLQDLSPYFFRKENKMVQYLVLPVEMPVTRVSGNRLYHVFTQIGVHLEVFDEEGRAVAKTVIRDLPRIRITTRDRARLLRRYEQSLDFIDGRGFYKNHVLPQQENRFPDFFPLYRQVYVDRGLIYFQTCMEKEGMPVFMVYNSQGKKIREVCLPVNSYGPMPVFRNGRFHVLLYDEEEDEWSLQIIDLLG